MKAIIFYYETCIYFSGLSLQGVNRNWCQSSIFYLTSSLMCGGYLQVIGNQFIYVATLVNL